jgi:hypothetical protein
MDQYGISMYFHRVFSAASAISPHISHGTNWHECHIGATRYTVRWNAPGALEARSASFTNGKIVYKWEYNGDTMGR